MNNPAARYTLLFLAAAAWAQPQDLPKEFDVATIKPNAANDNRFVIRIQPGGNFVTSGTALKFLMMEAYGVQDFQILGGPGWVESQRWDVAAKAEGLPDRFSVAQLRPLLQALLADRFQLKTHPETKEMPVYALVTGKSGPKLKVNTMEPGPRIMLGQGKLTFTKVRLDMLIRELSRMLGRIVIDKTELTGEYDFTLEWAPEPGQNRGLPGLQPPPNAPVDSNGPSIFTAIQEQLGLRLDSQKGPVEVIVIDHVEKPSEN